MVSPPGLRRLRRQREVFVPFHSHLLSVTSVFVCLYEPIHLSIICLPIYHLSINIYLSNIYNPFWK